MPFDGTAGARWQIDIMAADKTAQAFSSVDRRLKATNASITQMQSGLTQQIAALAKTEASWTLVARSLGPIAGLLSAATLAHRAWNAGMQSGALIDQAAQLGVTTDALQAYRAVAATSGVEVTQLDKALQTLTGQMGAARDGSDDVIARFDRLGVKLLDANGKLRGVSDVLPEVARGLLRMGSDSERNALAQDLLGNSGARTVTMLEQLSKGTTQLTQEMRDQGRVVAAEYLDAWNKVDAQLKVFNQTFDAFLVRIGAPIATATLEHLNGVLNSTRREVEAIASAWNAVTGIFTTSSEDLIKRQDTMKAQLENIKDSTDALDVAKVVQLRREIAGISDELANRGGARIYQMPEGTIAAPPGARNPTGKGAAKAGEDLAKKRLEESKKTLDQMLEEFEKIRRASEGVMDKFGNGVQFATREMAELNQMLELGYIDAQTFNVAAADIAQRAQDMDTAFRGAQGGLDGFLAGIEHAANQWERAGGAFEMGQEIFTTSIDLMSQAIADFATKGELDFNRLLGAFLNMLAQMAMAEAASTLVKTGISILGSAFGGAAGGGSGMTFADGGRPPVGMASLVGERGPELFVPDSAGTIVPNHELGGSTTVIVQQTVQTGSFATRAEMMAWAQVVEDRARQGAMAAVAGRKQRGDPRF